MPAKVPAVIPDRKLNHGMAFLLERKKMNFIHERSADGKYPVSIEPSGCKEKKIGPFSPLSRTVWWKNSMPLEGAGRSKGFSDEHPAGTVRRARS